MRASLLLLTLLLSATPVPGQYVKVMPAGSARDTSEPDLGTRLLEGYLRNRLNALGLNVVEPDAWEGQAAPEMVGWAELLVFEVHFSVMTLDDGRYDVASHLNSLMITTTGLPIRGRPLDWYQFHNADDLEVVAREIAEAVYGNFVALEKLGEALRDTTRS